jgi:hypothetical protein
LHRSIWRYCIGIVRERMSISSSSSSLSPSTATGFIKSIESGSKHLAIKRFTLRYPEQKLKFVGGNVVVAAVKRYFANNLSSAIKEDKKLTSKIIDHAQGNSKVKKYLKGI